MTTQSRISRSLPIEKPRARLAVLMATQVPVN
jgi:hypothetical protein